MKTPQLLGYSLLLTVCLNVCPAQASLFPTSTPERPSQIIKHSEQDALTEALSPLYQHLNHHWVLRLVSPSSKPSNQRLYGITPILPPRRNR